MRQVKSFPAVAVVAAVVVVHDDECEVGSVNLG